MSNEMMMMMPTAGIELVIERRNMMVEFVQKAMRRDVDYGIIPGTQKNTLLKPGAEKLNTLFGLTPRFLEVKTLEDWDGRDHNGEPFFYYWQKCQLLRDGVVVGEGDGSCNSWEKKYRYRSSERVCPNCGKPAIIKGKEEYGGGWLCFEKKGGCKSKFKIDDPAIIDQTTGQVANPEITDQVNTLLKMAQKRALIAATLLAVNASEFFTQDLEDMYIEATYREVKEEPKPESPTPAVTQASTRPEPVIRTLPEQVHIPSHENGNHSQEDFVALVKTSKFKNAGEIVKAHTANNSTDWNAAYSELQTKTQLQPA